MNPATLHRRPLPCPARRRRRGARLPAALALAALACATARTRPGPEQAGIEFRDPAVVEADPAGDRLASRTDEELRGLGDAAARAGDARAAAAAFGRLADAFPSSPRAAEARRRAGLAWRDLGRWDLARERFREAAASESDPEAAEDRLLEAESLYQLERPAEARALLEALGGRSDLPSALRARAVTQSGAIAAERGEADAERTLDRALALVDAAERDGAPADPYYAAKARFHLGELARRTFEAAPLDTADADADALADRLDGKSRLLLAAQERYLAAMRAGDPHWSVAAGTRVGELYETFHRQLLQAPLPPGLGGGASEAYRVALRQRLRVLVAKAVEAYEETLTAARRAGIADAFVARADEALRRTRRLLDEADAEVPPAPPVGQRAAGGDQERASLRTRSGYIPSRAAR